CHRLAGKHRIKNHSSLNEIKLPPKLERMNFSQKGYSERGNNEARKLSDIVRNSPLNGSSTLFKTIVVYQDILDSVFLRTESIVTFFNASMHKVCCWSLFGYYGDVILDKCYL